MITIHEGLPLIVEHLPPNTAGEVQGARKSKLQSGHRPGPERYSQAKYKGQGTQNHSQRAQTNTGELLLHETEVTRLLLHSTIATV